MTDEQRAERAQRIARAKDLAPFTGYTPANQHTTPLEEGPYLVERSRDGFSGPYVQVGRYEHEDGPPSPHTLRDDLGFGRFRVRSLHGGGPYQIDVRGGDPWPIDGHTTPASPTHAPPTAPAAPMHAYLNPPPNRSGVSEDKLITALNQQAADYRKTIDAAHARLEEARKEAAQQLEQSRRESEKRLERQRAEHHEVVERLRGRIQELQDEKLSLQLERVTPLNPPTLIDQIDNIKAIRDALGPVERPASALPEIIGAVLGHIPKDTLATIASALRPAAPAVTAHAAAEDDLSDYQLDDIDELAEELRSAHWTADEARRVLNAAAAARQQPQPA